MKFLPLVWAGLWRRPVRSILTASSIVVAFMLLGLLQGVNTGFDRAIAAANRNFLVTGTRVRGGAPMPISAMSKIRNVPGVLRTMGIRITSISLRADQPAVALITRPLGQADVTHKLPIVGNAVEGKPGLIGVFVSEPMVSLYNAQVGSTLELPMQAGKPPVEAFVRGVWRDYARQQGAIIIDEEHA